MVEVTSVVGRSRALVAVAVLVTLFVTAFARVAYADATPDDRARAKVHAEAGEKYFRLGDFDRAAKEFRAAYEAVPSPTLLYNLGQTYRQLHDYKQALFFYRQFLATGPDEENRRVVQERIDQLEKLVNEQSSAETAPPTGTAPVQQPKQSTAPSPQTPPGADLSAHAAPAERPIYKRPWFWGVVVGGAVVVAAGVTLGVVYGTKTKDPTPTLGVANAMGF